MTPHERPWAGAAFLAVAIVVGAAAWSVDTRVSPPATPPVIVTAPPVTLPPKTVKVTVRVTERASRSQVARPAVTATPTPVRYYNPEAASGVYQEYARRLVTAAEWPCLRRLWTRESNWRPEAVSPSGRHVGIPQLIGLKTTDGWKHQIKRGLAYIDARYGGSPCRALAHSDAKGYY
jgi:hypothetical protein